MFALIIDNTVHELFAAKPVLHPDLQVEDVSLIVGIAVGWIKGGDGDYSPPAAPPTPQPRMVFAPRDFIALFTPAEQAALFTARRTSTTVDMFITLAMAGPVDLTADDVIADIGQVETLGLLTASRSAQILAGAPAPDA